MVEEHDQETAAELSSKHGEIAAKEAQIFEAASRKHLVSLRLYFSTLQQFAQKNMPEALRIWEAKAARRDSLEATCFYKKKGEKNGVLEAFFLFSHRPRSIFFVFRYAAGSPVRLRERGGEG